MPATRIAPRPTLDRLTGPREIVIPDHRSYDTLAAAIPRTTPETVTGSALSAARGNNARVVCDQPLTVPNAGDTVHNDANYSVTPPMPFSTSLPETKT